MNKHRLTGRDVSHEVRHHFDLSFAKRSSIGRE